MKEEFVEDLNLSQYELDLELGSEANLEEVKRQADLISQNWVIPESRPQKPFLILLGGFQGSGKTTVVNHLKDDLGLVVISPDEIRHNLFSQQVPLSDNFVRLVNATKYELLSRGLKTGCNLVIDQAITPDRVKLIDKIIESHSDYRPISVFLDAPIEVLQERVKERPELPGIYKGTMDELEATMDRYLNRYGDPKSAGYTLVIDSVGNSSQDITDIIKGKLMTYTS